MGVEALGDERGAALCCNTVDWAFGPIISGHGGLNAIETANGFLDWVSYNPDPRLLSDSDLSHYLDAYYERIEESDIHFLLEGPDGFKTAGVAEWDAEGLGYLKGKETFYGWAEKAHDVMEKIADRDGWDKIEGDRRWNTYKETVLEKLYDELAELAEDAITHEIMEEYTTSRWGGDDKKKYVSISEPPTEGVIVMTPAWRHTDEQGNNPYTWTLRWEVIPPMPSKLHTWSGSKIDENDYKPSWEKATKPSVEPNE
jgi:hypothetical protein